MVWGAGLAWPAGRPDFFVEGPRPAPPARILMAPARILTGVAVVAPRSSPSM